MPNTEKKTYHHGNLHEALLVTATQMLIEAGVEALSLRKLAEKVGVSRTAAYHHFKNKNDLLCAIAGNGFKQWQLKAQQIFLDDYRKPEQQIKAFAFAYLEFANQNAHIYDLMFGGTIWKNKHSNQSLENIAYPTFDYQVEMISHWQKIGLLANYNSLRMSQVLWGTLHGIAKLTIDGIYTEQASIEEMCECAVDIFLKSAKNE